MRRFLRRFWAGAPQLQLAACEAAASCRAGRAPTEQGPPKIEHAPRVRPLGARLGHAAAKNLALGAAVGRKADKALAALSAMLYFAL